MPLVVRRAAPRAPFVSYPATARAERRAPPVTSDKFILLRPPTLEGLKARHMTARGEAPGMAIVNLSSPVRAKQKSKNHFAIFDPSTFSVQSSMFGVPICFQL
jgi:hypothetical protein